MKGSLDFVGRYASAELDLHRSITWAMPAMSAPHRLILAARLLQRSLYASGESDADKRFYILHLISELLAAAGFQREDRALLRQSLDQLEAAFALGESASPRFAINRCEAEISRRRLSYYTQHTPEANINSTSRLIGLVDELPRAVRPTDLLDSGTRLRRSYAAELAADTRDPEEMAWRLLAASRDLLLADEGSRSVELSRLYVRSETKLQILISVGQTFAVALLVEKGEFSIVDVPLLARDRIWPALARAHRAHHFASPLIDGSRNAVNEWLDARSALFDELAKAVQSLTPRINRASSVDCHLFGLSNVMPLVPVLVALSDYETPVAAIARAFYQPSEAQSPVGLIVAPGEGQNYLPHALDDVEFAADLYGVDHTEICHDPTAVDALSALTRARHAVFAGHGVASLNHPGDAELLMGGNTLRLADVLDTNLSAVELMVFAACESLAPDAQIHGNPLSFVTAAIYAGAHAATGSHFRTIDSRASVFTRTILEQFKACLLYTSPSPRDRTRSRMPSSA